MRIVRKPVAFNADDPDQLALLEHAAKRPNFSGYIKRLIQRDLEVSWSPQAAAQKEVPADIDRELMADLI